MRQFEVVWEVLALLTPMAPEHESSVQPLTRYLRERGRKVSGIDLAGAVSVLRVMTRAALNGRQNVDVVVRPTVSGPPPLVTDIVDREDPAADFENQKQWAAFTAAFNMTGHPASAFRCADAGGPSLGVQLVGHVFGEES